MSERYCLYTKSSFWEGMARLFDFSGELTKYNYSSSGKEADYRAIQSDWQFVGDDIRTAIHDFAILHDSKIND